MDALNKLLERFRGSLDSDRIIKEKIISSVKEIAGFEISLTDISIQGNSLKITTSPAKRNELKLKENQVLESVRAKTKLNLTRLVY